jgi:hypothetical protein
VCLPEAGHRRSILRQQGVSYTGSLVPPRGSSRARLRARESTAEDGAESTGELGGGIVQERLGENPGAVALGGGGVDGRVHASSSSATKSVRGDSAGPCGVRS